MSGPSPLWYTTRGLGMTLLLVLTGTVVLGVMTSQRWKTEGWPRFLTSELHRNLSLVGLALLPLHGLTVMLDSYARMGLADITIPFASSYRPLWLGLGVLAGELLSVLVVISLVRQRVGYRLWRLTHWAAYAAWPLALMHGLGTGSDTRFGWALLVYVGCVSAVLLAVLVRLSLHRAGPTGPRLAAGLLATGGVLGAAVFTMLGPMQAGWAAAAGTPPDLLGGRAAAAASPGPGSAQAASTPAPTQTPAATATGQGLVAGLDDQLLVKVARAEDGQRLTLTDQRDPTLQITVVINGRTATSGPLVVSSQGQIVCRTQAAFAQDMTAVCGKTRLTISLFQSGQAISGELVTG